MKPALGYDRPSGFDVATEPLILRFIHTMIGAGGDFPSGTVARQMVLACLTAWICSHPLLDVPAGWRRLAQVVAWGLVAVVALLRVYVSAHTPASVLVGVAVGILDFWFVALVFQSVVYPEARRMLPELARLWLLGTAWWLILGEHKVAVGIFLLSVVIVTGAWVKLSAAIGERLSVALFEDYAVRNAWERYRQVAASGRRSLLVPTRERERRVIDGLGARGRV